MSNAAYLRTHPDFVQSRPESDERSTNNCAHASASRSSNTQKDNSKESVHESQVAMRDASGQFGGASRGSSRDARSARAANAPPMDVQPLTSNPLAARPRLAADVVGDSINSDQDESVSQHLDFMMSSMRHKIQTAVADMQAELQQELQEDDLKIHHVLGQGAFGTVYHGAQHLELLCCFEHAFQYATCSGLYTKCRCMR